MATKKKKKIIILYSTGGLGHKKAADAIFDAFGKRKKDAAVEMIDVIEYANRFYKFIYKDFYVFLMSKGKLFWGFLYYFSNLAFMDALTRKIRQIIDLRSLGGLKDMLVQKAPDAIVTTHFLLPSIAGVLKKDKTFHARLYTVITDYGPHAFWLTKYMDKFFVGTESVIREMKKRKIPESKISATGIPAMKEFSKKFSVSRLQKEYGLDKKRKTVLVLSGGFGVGPLEKILFSLNACTADIQVITVCGHNKAAYNDINAIRDKLNYPVILFGFTDEVAQLMSVSDLIITKAGGISVTEALDSSLPMILFASIPGQETWNENLLLDAGAAEKAHSVKEIPVIANRILLSEDVYEALKEGIEKVRKPDAAGRIVDIVLEEIKEAGK